MGSSGARELVIDTELPETVLGFDRTDVDPGETFIINARTQMLVRPFALFIPHRVSEHFIINDLRIGTNSHFPSAAPWPADLFAWSCGHEDCELHPAMMQACVGARRGEPRLLRNLSCEDILPGVFCMINITNVTREVQPFHACLLCRRLEVGIDVGAP
jgi:hypothetical protein